MNDNDLEKIDGMIARHVGAFADSIQHKLDLVVEGQQMLSEKIDRVETRLDKRIDCLEHKLVAVAAETNGNTLAIKDLAAETKGNTLAIRDLAAETKGNTLAIRDLAAETKDNTLAIQDLSTKLDGVAADLSAHRRDTEAHSPVYRVKE
jgi:hypothetical protein